MAEQAITQGSIRSIFEPNGCMVEHPVMQCVQIKTMEPKQGDSNPTQRFRVVLSDVRNFIQTMLATTANDIVTSGKLKKGSIVRLKKYNPQMVKNKQILILMDIEVLEQYGEHDKIGQPEALDVGVKEEANPQPSAITSNGFYGQKPAQSAQQQQRALPVHNSNPRTSAHPHLYPIESISPYANKWTIRARCTHKGEIKTWHNQRGEGKLFSVNLLDETGEIRATGFSDAVDRLYDVFQEGTVYYISAPCRVQPAKRPFNNLPHDYELQFERDTTVEKAEDQENAPRIRFNFTKIGDLNNVEKDTTIDTIGILKDVGDVTTITSKSSNKDFSKRELTIADDTQTSVRLTIWGNTAQSFDAPIDSVIAFKGVKVSDFGGRSLSLLSAGSMTVDPDIDEAHKLRGWHDAVGSNVTFSTHQNTASTTASGAKQDFKTISQILEEETYLQDVPSYFSVKASVVFISDNPVAYPACKTLNCNKKVIEENVKEWWCEKCQKKWEKPEYRYVIRINVIDHTGQLWMNCFDEVGRLIIGIPADDIMAIKDQDDEKQTKNFDTVLQQDATCKTYNFRVRAKMEMYNEQPKPRYQVLNVYPLNFSQECNKLAQLLKQYDMDSDSLFIR
ncbi:replication factor-a protein [Lojkania enalia]|uniref:Replication protein A subunit n=1 Tax=Lojkania enalia TaxID=147567 RepID=A0A9P4N6J6_9PLEO|nr:replication factor-a protein [Didymosphaeria enalia]